VSTAGVVAVGTDKGWVGIYNHSDSYPTWLGRRIWEYLRTQGIQNYLATIANHPHGWSVWPEICYCHSEKFAADLRPIMYRSSDFADPCCDEYVYVLDPATNLLHILGSKRILERFQHRLLGSWFLTDNEPDWASLERRGAKWRE
jgi:hypothetical protein